MFKRILVPSDGSEHATKAADKAIQLAKILDAEIVAVHVIDEKLIQPFEVLEEEGMEILHQIQKKGESAGVEVSEVLLLGNPRHDMKKISNKTEADLIVIASHGRTGLEKILMGSVAENTLKTADIPVLLIK
ncbi:MAG: universal stress protein UspA [Methanobacterium sp.]|nr:MAG: universal stress protein UspA [Methanobacterium sp.]